MKSLCVSSDWSLWHSKDSCHWKKAHKFWHLSRPRKLFDLFLPKPISGSQFLKNYHPGEKKRPDQRRVKRKKKCFLSSVFRAQLDEFAHLGPSQRCTPSNSNCPSLNPVAFQPLQRLQPQCEESQEMWWDSLRVLRFPQRKLTHVMWSPPFFDSSHPKVKS